MLIILKNRKLFNYIEKLELNLGNFFIYFNDDNFSESLLRYNKSENEYEYEFLRRRFKIFEMEVIYYKEIGLIIALFFKAIFIYIRMTKRVNKVL